MKTILHWQIASPAGVQGWIQGSRRIRDFWASSFLTSWLSACAMKALIDGGYGQIVFPAVEEDPLWLAMHGRRHDGKEGEPHWFVGTLPNRFKAEFADVSAKDRFLAEDPCGKAVRGKWQALADAVWETFVNPALQELNGALTKKDKEKQLEQSRRIWKRQITGFWDINWVLGKDPKDGSDGAWLDRRKNWRAHLPSTEEPGDHCRMLGDFQELSGWVRAKGQASDQDKFWQAVRKRVRDVVNPGAKDDTFELLEIRNTERLSAPALVKRLFPCLPADQLRKVLGWVPQGLQEHHGRIPGDLPAKVRFWPSTAYMAAVPWMLAAWHETRNECEHFRQACWSKLHVPSVAEHDSYVESFRRLGREAREFGLLDGSFFFDDMLHTEARNLEREAESLEQTDPDRARKLRERSRKVEEIRGELARLREAYRRRVEPNLQPRQAKSLTASPFYALLVMDGDAIGKLLSSAAKAGRERDVSKALRRFTGQVKRIVEEERDGTLIYAGGDDVKAFLPLPTAIPCAIALRQAYLDAMKNVAGKLDEPPTISAGLVFAHYHVPLSSVIRKARDLLDKVAKEGNGRNSIAVSVEKPSGTMAEYVTSFLPEKKRTPEKCEKSPIDHMQKLARAYARDIERSTSFLYNMKDRYEHVLDIFGNDRERLEKVMLAEWVKGKKGRTKGDEDRIDELLDVCMTTTGNGKAVFRLAGGLIARFLADNGVGTLDARYRSPVPAGDGA